MIRLICGNDLTQLGIKTCEGLNISAFLDHIDSCDKCSQSKESLIRDLNTLIGGER
ncbi:hypothetical protein [Syntrophobacter fumaroxidans]|uniref:hypothetical protein n=1 Tax=Syntrophobacter fumaroxidans TaxID=119484 RepID=UPI000057308A|nr:hypothetical protein [Syntrophobacter fumaroxidans]